VRRFESCLGRKKIPWPANVPRASGSGHHDDPRGRRLRDVFASLAHERDMRRNGLPDARLDLLPARPPAGKSRRPRNPADQGRRLPKRRQDGQPLSGVACHFGVPGVARQARCPAPPRPPPTTPAGDGEGDPGPYTYDDEESAAEMTHKVHSRSGWSFRAVNFRSLCFLRHVPRPPSGAPHPLADAAASRGGQWIRQTMDSRSRPAGRASTYRSRSARPRAVRPADPARPDPDRLGRNSRRVTGARHAHLGGPGDDGATRSDGRRVTRLVGITRPAS
jgi:hypothetical protein